MKRLAVVIVLALSVGACGRRQATVPVSQPETAPPAVSTPAAPALTAPARPASPCPSTEDFECLLRHSFALSIHDPEQWWKIYNAGWDKAWACRTYADVARFLNLWAGGTDGETSEALQGHTEEILVSKPTCFLEGALIMEPLAQARLLKHFCHGTVRELSEKQRELFAKVLREYQHDIKYREITEPLLKRVNSHC